MSTSPSIFTNKKNEGVIVFVAVWLFTFVLYLPAAKAGFVSDFTGWLDQVQNHGFWEYINRKNFHSKSLYQVTQFTTYIFYKLLGVNTWAWHLLHITLHAINAALLYVLCRTLFTDAHIKNAREITVGGLLLFCVSPYISEVIVWEPSFHFLTGLLYILLILRWTQLYIHSKQLKYPLLAVLVFMLSTHTLEIFYITPWLALSLIAFYYLGLQYDKKVCRTTVSYFFLPMMVVFVAYFIEYRMVYHEWIAHIGTSTVTHMYLSVVLGKPAKYLFHILFLGRFFPDAIKTSIYSVLISKPVIALTYLIVLLICIRIAKRFSSMTHKARVGVLLFVWTGITLAILTPLWFPEEYLIRDDRYAYFPAPFIYMLLVLLLSNIANKKMVWIIVLLFAVVNTWYTVQVNSYWMRSEMYVNKLLNSYVPDNDRIVLLLNLPEQWCGASMISATPEGEFKLMLNLFRPEKQVTGKVYDVASFNIAPARAVPPRIVNDSTLELTLQGTKSLWWYNGFAAVGYETNDYRFIPEDHHHYLVVLKHPRQQYDILFNRNACWQTFDWKGQQDN